MARGEAVRCATYELVVPVLLNSHADVPFEGEKINHNYCWKPYLLAHNENSALISKMTNRVAMSVHINPSASILGLDYFKPPGCHFM